MLTEPEKEVLQASSYRIGTVFELVKTAIDDALEGTPMAGVAAARMWTEFIGVKRVIDRFKSNAELYPPLSWAQVCVKGVDE